MYYFKDKDKDVVIDFYDSKLFVHDIAAMFSFDSMVLCNSNGVTFPKQVKLQVLGPCNYARTEFLKLIE